MPPPHDRSAGRPASPSQTDPLSDVLRQLRLSGVLLFKVDASDPWCVDLPDAERYSDILAAPGRQVISFHVVVEGRGLASVPGTDPAAFETGDVLVFPHGDPYRMESAAGTTPEFTHDEMVAFLGALASGELPFTVTEGGGGEPRAAFVCGFLVCDARPAHPLVAALPRMLHVRSREGAADMLGPLTDLVLKEFASERPGGRGMRLDLAEMILAEVLRRHASSDSSTDAGWLRGLTDPAVRSALTAIHARPQNAWTLNALAREAAVSRSVLAERFSGLTGVSPMEYLANWRMLLAARQLREGARVGEAAHRAGYASEAAFSRAFKRMTGRPPSAFRSIP